MNHHLQPVVVIDPKDWHVAIVRAITEIEAKAITNHTAKQVIEALEKAIVDGACIVIVIVDTLTGKTPQESVCGLCSMVFATDHVGNKIAVINEGWVAPGYFGAPYKMCGPHLEGMARKEGCNTLRVITCRHAEPAESILSKFGFVRVGTIFDKFLVNK